MIAAPRFLWTQKSLWVEMCGDLVCVLKCSSKEPAKQEIGPLSGHQASITENLTGKFLGLLAYRAL